MGSPQEPRELLLGETNRQRKWAPRTRTGCLTCRTRRIKCDEAKPACRQCIKSCVECRGLLYGKPEGNHPGILQEIVPPSWDFLQSIQYYLSNMAPSLQQGRVIINRLPKSVYQQRRLITLVITDRIERASKARGHPLHAGQDTAFAGIWITFTRYKLEHIGYANQLLKNDEQHECEIFSVINLLIRLDLIMQNTSWQSHMKGYLTYMEYLGGVKKVLALPIPPHTHSISSRISTCICVNTTSPATRQFTAIYRLNDEHIEAAIASCCGDNFFGCPPRVQMAIFHISKLRLLAVCNAKIKEQEFVDKIQYIAQGLDHVDVEEWAREKLGDLPETATLATIFRTMTVAVRLYGILSLPKNYAAAWLAPSSRGTAGSRVRDRLDVYHRVRIWHRERLLELLRITRDKLCDPKISRLFTWSVGWPLLVAGVAAADGSKETHELITGTLITLSQKPNAPFCVMTAVEKLRRFWRLELTEWDECFSEPLVLYL